MRHLIKHTKRVRTVLEADYKIAARFIMYIYNRNELQAEFIPALVDLIFVTINT